MWLRMAECCIAMHQARVRTEVNYTQTHARACLYKNICIHTHPACGCAWPSVVSQCIRLESHRGNFHTHAHAPENKTLAYEYLLTHTHLHSSLFTCTHGIHWVPMDLIRHLHEVFISDGFFFFQELRPEVVGSGASRRVILTRARSPATKPDEDKGTLSFLHARLCSGTHEHMRRKHGIDPITHQVLDAVPSHSLRTLCSLRIHKTRTLYLHHTLAFPLMPQAFEVATILLILISSLTHPLFTHSLCHTAAPVTQVATIYSF